MKYAFPKCLNCKNFRGMPTGAKDRPKCFVKTKGVPDSIYFKGKDCPNYVPVKQ